MYARYRWTLAFFLGGCTVGGDDPNDSGSPSSDTGDDRTGGGGGSVGAGGDAASTEPPALEGTWAQSIRYASINNVPAVGQTNGSVTTIQRVWVVRDGTALSIQAAPCAIEIDNGTPVVSTIIPNAFVASLGTTPRSGALVLRDSAWWFVQDENLQLRGVRLVDPILDELPTEAADPRVWDQDGDGNPGVTVRVTGITDGEVYLVQRDTHSLEGQVMGDRIDGLAEWATEQVVLGSDNPILDSQTSSVKDPDPEASYFRSTRIDPSKDCEAILAERDELFGR